MLDLVKNKKEHSSKLINWHLRKSSLNINDIFVFNFCLIKSNTIMLR